jgi:high-affinity K+ transport system ATPase subunit B
MRRFKLRYTGGFAWMMVITLMSLTVILIPLAITALIDCIEIIETKSE